MRFIFFTKTTWQEPPRLRHQVAELLTNEGHEVVFFEKPVPFYRSGSAKKTEQPKKNLFLKGQRQLMHHKLRLFKILHYLNSAVLKRSIRRALPDISPEDVIMNFNYEYFFLRDIFPSQKIITVINDDFIAVAFDKKMAEWALLKTCDISHALLTVSIPLQKNLARFGDPQLFLPWTSNVYEKPTTGIDGRNTLLFWGYINYRLDYDHLYKMIDVVGKTNPEINFLFIGPIGKSTRGDNKEELDELIAKLRQRPNVAFMESRKLCEIDFSKVLAALIPYRAHDLEIDAITISNKTFQLLSKGLPVFISSLPAMPNFVKTDFVFRVDATNINERITFVRDNFQALQPHIEQYVNDNTARIRYLQLKKYIS